MVQIAILTVINQSEANETLRTFQREYPKRKIIGVSMTLSTVFPQLWFMTITYEIEGM